MIPFKTGVQVTGKDFCPRSEETRQLCELMQSSSRVYVVGERRIGKTSLIAEAARRLGNMRPVFVDLMAVKTLEDLTHRLGQAILRAEKKQNRLLAITKHLASLRPSISIDSTTGTPSVTFGPGTGTRLETLDSLFAVMEKEKHRQLVLDEFQDIAALNDSEQILARLRSLIQQQQKTGVVFCGSVRSQMEALFTLESSPFFNAAVPLPVGPLDRTLFRRFLLKRFNSGERTVPECMMDSIMDACQNNPGHIQRFCISLWQISSRRQMIGEKDVVAAWETLFAMQKDAYELLLATLSPQQMKVLCALAKTKGSSGLSSDFIASTGITLAPSVRKAMQKLVQRRLVQKTGTTYRFCDPFLAAWLRQQHA